MDQLNRFLTAKVAANLSAATVAWYARHLRQFFAFVADPSDPREIRGFLADRRTVVSKAAVDAHYRALSAYFAWCVDEGVYPVSPLATVKRPKREKRSPRRTSFAQYVQLLESIPRRSWIDLRDRLMVQLLFLSGLRVSELTGLMVPDVDIAARVLRCIGKGDLERLVPMHPSIGPALLEYLLQRPHWAGNELFLSDDGAGGVRGALGHSGVRQRLRTLCARAGVSYINPHSFRHGLAMWLLNEGHADMSLIQRILGHSDIKTTQRFYADWLTDGMISAYDDATDRAKRRRQ